LLEIETIAASKRRHALQLLPQRYRKEMEGMYVVCYYRICSLD